jgi:hypothetical protein
LRYQEILEACWKGYRQAGMKDKGGRQVPNCVPVSEQEMEEDLKKWFKEKWVRFGPDGKIRGDCARGSSSEGKPKCLPQAKAQALGKKGRASSAAKKRREDPNPERRGAAKNVATRVKEDADQWELRITDQWEDEDPEGYSTRDVYKFDVLKNGQSVGSASADNYFANLYVDLDNGKQFELQHQTHEGHPLMNEYERLVWGLEEGQQLDEKQDACYRKVKSRYKVWPSAYASGALVQCRKKGAANWGNKDKK